MGEQKKQPKYRELDKSLVLNHYDRPVILQAMLDASLKKEVVGSFGGVGYARRPDVVQYTDDILTQVKNGVTSFHASEELWEDPLMIHTGMKKDELSQMRVGWDLILDLDCPVLEYSKIACDLLVKEIKRYGVNSVSVKFSGNHGFHIAVPFEAFPAVRSNGEETRLLFPEAPRNIADFLGHNIKSSLRDALLAVQKLPEGTQEFDKLEARVRQLAKSVEMDFVDILEVSGEGKVLDPFKILSIDTILITSRHLYRQVYSLNEKSGMVSLPINPDKVLSFNPDVAKIEHLVFSKFTFLDRSNVVEGEAQVLMNAAYDYAVVRNRVVEEEREKRLSNMPKFFIGEKIPEECFPPQIKAMLGPIADGKKRAMFILTQFLRCVGWDNAEVEKRIRAWNESQEEGLRESYLQGQLHHFQRSEEAIPPQNFTNTVYKEIIGDITDALSQKVKNPVSYAKIKFETAKEMAEKEKKVLTAEEKALRKKEQAKKSYQKRKAKLAAEKKAARVTEKNKDVIER